MASNIDVTLKRYNEQGEYDKILPATHLGQLYTDNTLSTKLGAYLNTTFINVNQIGAADGLATLDGNQKVPYAQLPDSILGGLKFVSALIANTDLDSLGVSFTNATDAIGSYYIATADIELTSTANSTVLAPGDEGDSTFPITIEAGDWVIITDWASGAYTFAIINNTYQNATSDAKGIVTLSNITNLGSASGNNVITDGILAGLIGTATGEIAAGDHLHDDRYYTETEAQAFFSGDTAITGYNKTNWDAAYDDKINSVDFNTADGVLTLTQQDSGTLTVDLDGRYLEGLTAAQTDSTTGIVVANTGQDFTVAHADTSSVSDVTNTNGSVIQSMTFDTFGHLQTHATVDLDDRYYTETEFNTWLNGQTAIDEHFFTEILYGEGPTAVNAGTIIIDTAQIVIP
jgi:hypothetical protein